MRKLKILLLTVVVSGVVSCNDAVPRAATRDTTLRDSAPKIPRYQQTINTWIGAPVNEIITEWGAPTKTFVLSGKEYIVYIYTSTITQPGSSNRYGLSSGGYSYRVTDCTWTFEIRRGTIAGGNAVGNDCTPR